MITLRLRLILMRARLALALLLLALAPAGCYTPTDVTASTAPSASYRGSPITRDVRALRQPLDLRDARQAYARLRQAALNADDPTGGSATLAACAEAIRPLEIKPPQALTPEERTQLRNIQALLRDIGSPEALLLVSGTGRPERAPGRHADDLQSLAVYVDWAAWRIDPQPARKAARGRWLTDEQLTDLRGIVDPVLDALGPDLLASIKPSVARPLRVVVGPVLIAPMQRQAAVRVPGTSLQPDVGVSVNTAAAQLLGRLGRRLDALPGVIALNAAQQAGALAALNPAPATGGADASALGTPAPATHRLLMTAHPDVVVLDLLDLRTGHLSWSGLVPLTDLLPVDSAAKALPDVVASDVELVGDGAQRAADTVASIAIDAQRRSAGVHLNGPVAGSLQAALASSGQTARPRVRLNRFRAPPQLQDLADALYHRLKSALARRFDVIALDAEGQGYVLEALQSARQSDDEALGNSFTRAFGVEDLPRERLKADYVVFGAFEGRWAGRRCDGVVELVLGDAATGNRIGSARWAIPGAAASAAD